MAVVRYRVGFGGGRFQFKPGPKFTVGLHVAANGRKHIRIRTHLQMYIITYSKIHHYSTAET